MTAGPTVTDQPAVATGTAVTAMTAGDRCVGAIATFAAVAAADRPVVAGRQTIGPRASTGAARRPPGSASPTQARVATVTAGPAVTGGQPTATVAAGTAVTRRSTQPPPRQPRRLRPGRHTPIVQPTRQHPRRRPRRRFRRHRHCRRRRRHRRPPRYRPAHLFR